jgi:hypothetical protein
MGLEFAQVGSKAISTPSSGRVDLLINAGTFPFRDIWDLDFAECKRI